MHLRRAFVVGLRSASVLLLAGLATAGCQVVLGDFQVDDSEIDDGALGSACAPNTFRCRGERLESCRADRRGFEPFATCESADLCDATAGSCRTCSPNQLACSDGELRTCAADATWTNPVKCETRALCRVAPDRTTGGCDAPVCAPGAFTCDEGWLLSCAAGRDRWNLVEYCGTNDRCDPVAAAAAVAAGKLPHCASLACPGDACPTPACTPGATRCSTEVPAVELCSTNGEWIPREACASRELCDAKTGRCLPRACNLGDTRCVGQVRQTCAQDLTSFDDLERCPDGTTCAPGGCEPGQCADGTVRCNGISFETCIAGEFVATNRCATRALCDPVAGCVAPACDPLAPSCTAEGRLITCPPSRDVPREITCPAGTTCNARAGRCL